MSGEPRTGPRVLLLYADLGGAHRAMVEALSESLHPYASVAPVDLFAELSRLCQGIAGWYPFLLRDAPWLYNAIYGGAARKGVRDGLHRYLLEPALAAGTRALIRRLEPGCVITLFPFLPRVVASVLRDVGASAAVPHVVLPADPFNVHPAWAEPSSTMTLVASPEAERALVHAGVRKERIRVTRYPVRRRFRMGRIHEGPADTSADTGADHPSRLRVMVMGGGDGVLHMTGICRELLSLPEVDEIVAVPGRHAPLRRNLERLAGKDHGRLRVCSDWSAAGASMAEADLLVTKPGPSTIMEAVQMGLPLLLTEPVPRQEEGNVRFVLREGMGLFTKESGVAAAARECLQPANLGRLRLAARRARERLPLLDPAECILELTASRRSV